MEHARGRRDGQPSRQGTGTFSGRVMLDPLLDTDDGKRQARVNSVVFEPGARTFWHSHDDGQFLLVSSGRGVVQNRGGDSRELLPGDSVWAPPGEEHWHGAAPDSFLVHTAVSLGTTQWQEEVSGERYRAAFGALGPACPPAPSGWRWFRLAVVPPAPSGWQRFWLAMVPVGYGSGWPWFRLAAVPVDNGGIGGKFLIQSSTGVPGRCAWHVALVQCRGEGSQPLSDRGQYAKLAGVRVSGRLGVGPGRGPGGSVDNGAVLVADGDGSGPKAPPGPSSAGHDWTWLGMEGGKWQIRPLARAVCSS